jgi:hypothetical protein
MKIEKRVYEHDDNFMKYNSNFDSLHTSFIMVSPTISGYEDRIAKRMHLI